MSVEKLEKGFFPISLYLKIRPASTRCNKIDINLDINAFPLKSMPGYEYQVPMRSLSDKLRYPQNRE